MKEFQIWKKLFRKKIKKWKMIEEYGKKMNEP